MGCSIIWNGGCSYRICQSRLLPPWGFRLIKGFFLMASHVAVDAINHNLFWMHVDTCLPSRFDCGLVGLESVISHSSSDSQQQVALRHGRRAHRRQRWRSGPGLSCRAKITGGPMLAGDSGLYVLCQWLNSLLVPPHPVSYSSYNRSKKKLLFFFWEEKKATLRTMFFVCSHTTSARPHYIHSTLTLDRKRK
jgi:hypothetical protein